jgi:hypothetical protein
MHSICFWKRQSSSSQMTMTPNLLAFCAINEWGDDFDPGHVKHNKGSIYIFVVSFSCPASE